MLSHNERFKSTFFQRFCEHIRADAFICDDRGDPELHLLASLWVGELIASCSYHRVNAALSRMSKTCSTLRDANQASCLSYPPSRRSATVSSSRIRHRVSWPSICA